MTKLIEDRYLGDGVYASFDGYHIVLDTRAQTPVNRIALEPPVMANLALFQRDLARAASVEPDEVERDTMTNDPKTCQCGKTILPHWHHCEDCRLALSRHESREELSDRMEAEEERRDRRYGRR